MNKWTALTIVFGLLSFGAVQETWRIMTSHDSDIAGDRQGLFIMAAVITTGMVAATIIFWIKSTKK